MIVNRLLSFYDEFFDRRAFLLFTIVFFLRLLLSDCFPLGDFSLLRELIFIRGVSCLSAPRLFFFPDTGEPKFYMLRFIGDLEICIFERHFNLFVDF